MPFGQSLKRYTLRERPFRLEVVRTAFVRMGGRLDVDDEEAVSGTILAAMLDKGYNAGRSREVVSRQKSEKDATRDMMSNFGVTVATYHEFEGVCDAMSSLITDDGYFALQMSNLWGAV